MTNTAQKRRQGRIRRHRRVRQRIRGSARRPRLAVYRSNKHITAQLIDDLAGHTLLSASTLEPDLRQSATGNITAATAVGTLLAERATAAGLTSVVFDRGGYLYHGRVAAVAEAARAGGLEL